MNIDDILEFDVNCVIKKEIRSTLNSYEKKLNECNNEKMKLKRDIEQLSKKISENNNILFLATTLQETYSNIQGDPSTTEFPKSKFYRRFKFIENIMKALFGIEREYDYNIRSDSYLSLLPTNLVINYYNNKELLINILKILDPSFASINFIRNFKMPFDYCKDDVIKYVKDPQYNTNGCIFGITEYWLEYGACDRNLPHDLIMQNPHILEPDVFNVLLDTIKHGRSYFYYLFALPVYNKNISENHIKKLGECLLDISDSVLKYDIVHRFVINNLHKFNKDTLDFLFNKITDDNQFRIFHWENFPIEYQMKYLKSQPFDRVFRILRDSSCKWKTEDKEKFFKYYFKD